MKKIAIISDSSISFTKEEAKKWDVYILPNVIIHNDESYLDQITITNKEINHLLREKERITTSQANIGTMTEMLKKIQRKNYDHIIILTIASVLSGVYNGFVQASKFVALENFTIIDTHSIAGPVQQAVRAIRQMNANGYNIQEILDYLEFLFKNQVSYLYPKSLDQIVASGRVSKTASKIASFLRIKPIVYLSKTGDKIDRFGIARTDERAFDKIIEHFKKHKVTPEKYDLFLLENENIKQANTFKESLFKKLGEFNSHIIKLPAALSVHAGIGAIAIQWCPKIPR